jgi:hypothetical protein
MLLYITATPRVISIVIMVEQTEEGKELPVVRDITPGIPKYPFIMTNIYIIYQVIYAGILKSKQAAA